MPTHTGSRRPPKNNNDSNNTGNDFKSLKALYRQQLPTLRELFPGWSQEDLVAAMHEANGDLELTIGRIMEGHANQWDQVKVKKSKPPQKQPTANGTTNNNPKKTEGLTGTRDASQATKGKNTRTRGKFGHKGQRNKKDNEDTKPVEKEEEKKPSWASILKGPTKPEPPVELPTPTSQDTSITNDHSEKVMEPDGQGEYNDNDKLDTTQESMMDQVDLIVDEQETVDATEQLDEEQHDTTETNDNDESTLVIESLDTTTPTESQELQQFMAFRKVPVRRLKQDEPVVLPGGASGLENVSLQFGSLNLSNTEEKQPQPIEQDKEENIEPEQQDAEEEKEDSTPNATTSIPAPIPQASALTSTTNTTTTTTTTSSSATVSSNLTNSTKASDTTVYHQPQAQQQPQVQPTQVPQPQIQQYQQNFQPQLQQQHSVLPSSETHINPYIQYAPNAIPTNGQLQGFTDPGMVTVPDYYNSDAQRPMNYYDSSIYNQSPSVGNAHLYGRGKFNNMQEGMTPSPTSLGVMGNHNSTPVMQVPHQPQAGMYGGSAGNYYSYYCVPSQYQSYQQSGYQQPVPQQYQPPQQFQHPQQQTQPSHQIPQQQQPQQQVPQQQQPQQQQSQQPQQQQQPQSQKPPQTSYMNPNAYPMYGKQNNMVYPDYTNPQSYDDSMLHSNGTQGLMYDKQYQSPNNTLPQMQQYLGGNMNSQLQNQNQQQPSGMVNGQPKDTMMNGYDKQGQPMHQQPVLNQASYQPQFQQYNQPQYQQQQQPFLYQQQPYNPSAPNNTMNTYPARQQPHQQNPYWNQS